MAILFAGIELGTNPELTATTPMKLINGVQNVGNNVSEQDVIKEKNDTKSTNSLAHDNLNVDSNERKLSQSNLTKDTKVSANKKVENSTSNEGDEV